MKTNVTFLKNGIEQSITFDAIDEQTIKKAINQWRVRNQAVIISMGNLDYE